ncbi:hypothetical protein FALBO_13078 [Fusarium albosuccineum]|uniref:Histidine kinase n=1 Tax=Fusarium albosuccineum TaxID=1237068 RepID=A0A8H4L1Y4_9HYPO|nr:hypothetical protein FALBO_13078 [Fusarium albosuccineum]
MTTDTSQSRHAMPHKVVSEAVREREMLRHWLPFQTAQALQDFRQRASDTDRLSSENIILTALAQLGIYQVGAERALVSLFDSEYQYFVAEATSGTYLRPSVPNHEHNQPFRLCGTAARRGDDACDYTLLNQTSHDPEDGDRTQLPVTVVSDLVNDDRFKARTLPMLDPRSASFYAAVPIRTKRGINIGVYSVLNTSLRQWTDLNAHRLRDISSAISSHLETESLKAANRRNTRMNRGLGSFLEGSSTLSGWRLGSNPTAFTDFAGLLEGSLNQRQQSLQQDSDEIATGTPQLINDPSQMPHDLIHDPLARAEDISDAMKENRTLQNVFSRAANIIRESVEVEGCLFLDATMAGYRAQKTRATGDVGSLSSTSSDENTHGRVEEQGGPICDIRGYSTSTTSSIDRARHSEASVSLPEKFMKRMLKRYPQGKIFNFSDDGELQTSDSSSDEVISWISEIPVPPTGQDTHRSETQTKPLSRQREGKAISAAFPGARSVAFFPVWDPRQERWCASGLVYTNTPVRAFTVEGELSYLRAFGMLAIAEVVRLEALQADKAKSDALGSLSHELRSPLHGVLLSTELIADTKLDVFQCNIAHTIETCSRTLLDTIDNLLDYSKVNSFADPNNKSIGGKHSSHTNASTSQGLEKKSLVSNYPVDELVEEVVESVFAGFNFQHKSINQHVSRQRASSFHADNAANSASDYLEAMDQLSPGIVHGQKSQFFFGNITVILSLDASCDWLFRFQVGAVRRIVMNLVGNAFKYTRQGTVTISLTQQTTSIRRRKPEQVIRLTIQDTGKGIGADYLNRGIFKPFSQEDNLSPGTGVGLNLVKQIVSRLRGQISIESQVDVGTLATVLLPLERPNASEAALELPDHQVKFNDQVLGLAGLRVRIISKPVSGSDPSLDLRNALDQVCREWLKLELLADEDYTKQPDLVLWTQDALPTASQDMSPLAYAPNVVLCSDALAAYDMTRESETAGWRGIFEFVPQPAGPRKLAKTLALAYSRWIDYEHPSPSVSPFKAPRPSAPGRNASYSMPTTQTEPRKVSSGGVLGRAPKIHTPPGEQLAVDSPDETTSKFLLVDDNHINLKILSAYMKKLQLPYDTALNGKEAVDLYMQSPQSYVCILLDISMPVMNGFEAARQIRAFESQHGVEKGVLILALSGLASEEAQREAYGSGFDLFLLKPVKLQVLGDTLKQKGVLDFLDT